MFKEVIKYFKSNNPQSIVEDLNIILNNNSDDIYYAVFYQARGQDFLKIINSVDVSKYKISNDKECIYFYKRNYIHYLLFVQRFEFDTLIFSTKKDGQKINFIVQMDTYISKIKYLSRNRKIKNLLSL